VHRLRAHRPFWLATMHLLGVVCPLTLSIITEGYRLEWDPDLGMAPPAHLSNHPSAHSHHAFVTGAVTAGTAASIMQRCCQDDLHCVLPLGVAVNSVSKLRLIWDGRHVNEYLTITKFKMETLQSEGRTLFDSARFGGSVDISGAYHHVDMHPSAFPYLGFEWEGEFYRFVVLPFGLATAPRIFTLVMSHTVRFLRSIGVNLLIYLDNTIFAASTAKGALCMGHKLLATFPKFGWIIQPLKCVGCLVATPTFTALGIIVDLSAQRFLLGAGRITRILCAIDALLAAPDRVSARALARVKGALSSAWVALGSITRARTRAMDCVIESRPPPTSASWRAVKATWNAITPLSTACIQELTWWRDHISDANGQPIRPRPFDTRFDGTIFVDSSDTGTGALLLVEGPEAAASSLVAALCSVAPRGMISSEVVWRASRWIKFMAAF